MPSHEEAEASSRGEGVWRDFRFSIKKLSLVNWRESPSVSQSRDSPGVKVSESNK